MMAVQGERMMRQEANQCRDWLSRGVGMRLTLSKGLALTVATGWVIAAFAFEGSWTFALTVAAGTLLPLAVICFPEFLGSLTGWGTRARINRPSPPWLVAALGWLFLLGLPALTLLLGRISQ